MEDGRTQTYECLVAQTALAVPFHWGQQERLPGERYLLMDKLLQRYVVHPETGQRDFLWEINRTVPFEIGELSAYLKHVLGWDDTVRYYQENRTAKEKAFGLGGHSPSCAADARCQHGAGNAATARMTRRADDARGGVNGHNGNGRGHNGNGNGNGGDEELMEEVVGGEDTKGFENMELWKCQRLEMADHVRRAIFSHTRLWAHADADKVHIESSSNTLGGDPHAEGPIGEWQGLAATSPISSSGDAETSAGGDRVSCRVDVTRVELILYPLGNGILLFHVDWKPDPACPLALDQLRSWLYMAKFKHKVRGIFYGWTLGDEFQQQPSGPHARAHTDSLGKLAHAMHVTDLCLMRIDQTSRALRMYGKGFASLSSIGNWLVHLPHENSLHPPRRISYSAYVNHHSVVVIDRQPSTQDLRDYLRHLTRAFNVSSMTPDVLLPEAMHHHTLEHILPHRRNRYLGVSVEGNVSFSWITEDSNLQFECVTWPKVYQGVYLLLDIHTRGEGNVLSELSRMSAKVAEHLHLSTYEKLEKDRLRLRSVAMQMIKYSLGLSSDVCSGMSEYAQYFTTLRKVLGIPSGKQKIREEIEHVLNIVESVYLEEQRRKKQQSKMESKEKELARRKIESLKEARRQRFETLISITGTVSLPLVLVGGLMGMNLDDLPNVGFWPLMGYTASASFILFLLLMLWYSKLHHFIFRRFWAREAAVLRHHQLPTEVEEEEEEEEDKFDFSNGSSSVLHRLTPHAASAAAESDTTPLLFRG